MTSLTSTAALEAAIVLQMLCPQIPLLLMGEETASTTPFLFFTDHEPELGRLVAEGRRAEFASFAAFAEPEVRARIPDPQAPSTFEASRLKWAERGEGEHARTLELYKKMLSLRRSDPVLSAASRRELGASSVGGVLRVQRAAGADRRWLVSNFGESPAPVAELGLEGASRVLLRSDLGPLDITTIPGHTAAIIAG